MWKSTVLRGTATTYSTSFENSNVYLLRAWGSEATHVHYLSGLLLYLWSQYTCESYHYFKVVTDSLFELAEDCPAIPSPNCPACKDNWSTTKCEKQREKGKCNKKKVKKNCKLTCGHC